MRLSSLALLGTGLIFALVACRDDGGTNPGDDAPMPDAPPVGGVVTIPQIQDPAMPVGTAVEVKGVVVTAIDNYGTRTGDFWVQDPAGGPFSGIKVFGATLDQVAAIAPGDLVDIASAQKDEFALTSDMTGRKVTELKPVAGTTMRVTKTGSGVMPTPAAVDAKALAAMTKELRDAEWEKWEGVLITVSNARQIGATRSFGSMPGPDSNEFRITGFARVQSILTEMSPMAVFGVCYDKITGIGDYFFNDLVLPRNTADVVGGGAGCNPMATTVVGLQGGTNTEVVDLTNAVVIARDDIGTAGGNNKGFWIADAAQAAPNNGVYVFTRADMAPATYVVGARVNVQGGVEEFDLGANGMPPMGDTLTEVVDPIHALGAGAAVVPLPVTVTAEVAADIGAPGEAYEGVLVRINTLKVTNINAGAGKVELTDNAGKKIIMDDDAFAWGAQVLNTCYGSLTGVMSVQINDNVRTLNPRSAADMTVGVGCN